MREDGGRDSSLFSLSLSDAGSQHSFFFVGGEAIWHGNSGIRVRKNLCGGVGNFQKKKKRWGKRLCKALQKGLQKKKKRARPLKRLNLSKTTTEVDDM